MQNTLYTITGAVTLKKGAGRSLKAGGMWVYDNEIASVSSSTDEEVPDGGLVHVLDFDGFFLGTGFINRRSKITVRLLARRKDTVIDDAFWEAAGSSSGRRTGSPAWWWTSFPTCWWWNPWRLASTASSL